MNDSEHTHTHSGQISTHFLPLPCSCSDITASKYFWLNNNTAFIYINKHFPALVCRAHFTPCKPVTSSLIPLHHNGHGQQSILYTWSAEHTLHMVSRAYLTHGQQSILYTWSTEHTLHMVCRVYFTHGPHSILYTLQASQGPCHPTPSQWTWSAEHTLHMVSRAYFTHGL